MIGAIIEVVGTFIACIIVHELGHILYFQQLDKEVQIHITIDKARIFGIKMPFSMFSIHTGKPEDYDGLTHQQVYMLTLAGIAAGFAPLLVMVIAYDWLLIFLLPAYLLGVQKDIKILLNTYRGMKDELIS